MVLQAITYFLQVLTYFTTSLTDWEVDQGVSIGSVIVWYLSILVILWTIGKIVTGQHTGSKGEKHD